MALIGPISGSSGLSSVIGITGSLDITYDGETSEQADGYIQMTAVTAPGTPATDRGRLYVALNAGTPTLYFKDDEGTATSCIQGGGGGGTTINNATENELLTVASSTDELDAEANLTYDGTDLKATSSSTNKPVITIENTHNGATSGWLKFVNDKDAAGADDDVCGTITFYGDDDAQTLTEFARIEGIVADASNSAEGGKLKLSVATHDAEMQPGLIITDGSAEDEVDVTIANGVGSITTVNGCIGWGDTTDITGRGESRGDVVFFGTGTVAAGKIYYYKSDGSWAAADAASPAGADNLGLLGVGVATGTAGTVGMLLRGLTMLTEVTAAAGSGSPTVGDVLYLQSGDTGSTGTATSVAPANSGEVVRVIGYSLHATSELIYFNPDQTWVVRS